MKYLLLLFLLVSSPAMTTGAYVPGIDHEALVCLAKNIYYEARGEIELGMQAVAHVTLNRAAKYGKTVCEVVYTKYAFSWTQSSSRRERELPSGASRAQAEILSRRVLALREYLGDAAPDPTRGSLFFHEASILPYWAETKKRVRKIGNHIFYKEH